MRSLTKSILSILAFAFALWAIWTGYKIWKGEWENPADLSVSFLIIVALVITCAYLIAAAIQKSAEISRQNAKRANKIKVYEKVLELLQTSIFEKRLEDNRHLWTKAKLLLGLHSPLNILQAVNKLEALQLEEASSSALNEAMIELILLMRTDIGQLNFNVKSELELLMKTDEK